MAKIFYSMSGEGRGHAARVRTVTEMLRREHEVILLAPHFAYDFLSRIYQGTEVEVRRIPGLAFHYDRKRRLHWPKTLWANGSYVVRLPGLVRRIARMIREERPHLAITDFEPALPLAAARARLPSVSLDHQQFLSVSDLSALPGDLRRHAAFMGWGARLFRGRPSHLIVSSFYFPPIKERLRERVTQVGVLLRPEILDAEPERGEHLVVYFRRFAPPSALAALRALDREVHVYGLGPGPTEGKVHYHEVGEKTFLAHLASARALISTAGNQLVGEALYLGKPVLAMPEPKNHEQRINAWFLERSGAGRCIGIEELDEAVLADFLADAARHESAIDRERLCGNREVVARIERLIGEAALPRSARAAMDMRGA